MRGHRADDAYGGRGAYHDAHRGGGAEEEEIWRQMRERHRVGLAQAFAMFDSFFADMEDSGGRGGGLRGGARGTGGSRDPFGVDPFDDPFFGSALAPRGPRGGFGAGGGFGMLGGGMGSSLFGEMVSQGEGRGSTSCDPPSPTHTQDSMFDQMAIQSSSSSGGGVGMAGKSVMTSTVIRNGKRVTKTTTTIRSPDGTVSTDTHVDGDESLLPLSSSARETSRPTSLPRSNVRSLGSYGGGGGGGGSRRSRY